MPDKTYIELKAKNLLADIRTRCENSGHNADEVILVAVSKSKPVEYIKAAFKAGLKDFGENYIQEAFEKHEILKELRINWHFIGAVQTNKVKYLTKFCYLLHSLDRKSLADELQKKLKADNKTMNCLIQVNTSGEPTKSGIAPEQLKEFAEYVSHFDTLKIQGLMTIAENSEDKEAIRKNFRQLKELFDDVKKDNYKNSEMKYISMGMSNDYDIAIEEGSNMLRIGSAIFGERK